MPNVCYFFGSPLTNPFSYVSHNFSITKQMPSVQRDCISLRRIQVQEFGTSIYQVQGEYLNQIQILEQFSSCLQCCHSFQGLASVYLPCAQLNQLSGSFQVRKQVLYYVWCLVSFKAHNYLGLERFSSCFDPLCQL